MYAPSTQTSLFEISDAFPTPSSAARPARTSAPRTPKAKASKAKGRVSTSKPSALSENAVLAGSLLKTALICELEAQTGCSASWKASATPAGRSWYVLATSERTIRDPGHGSSASTLGSLPTPMVMDGQRNGAGGGAGSTYPMRKILTNAPTMATPRKSDADRGGRGDVLAQLRGYPSRHAGMPMMPTPMANDGKMEGWTESYSRRRSPRLTALIDGAQRDWETLPTPTKRDKRMDAWSPAYDRRKSPTMDAVMSGAMMCLTPTPTATANQTSPSMQKWAGARALASLLQSHGLTGTAALPITYGWMMGFPPGWLARALQKAVQKGRLQPASSSKPSATRSSRRSQKP